MGAIATAGGPAVSKPVDKATSRWRTFWHELKVMTKSPRVYEKTQLKRAFRRWGKRTTRDLEAEG